MSELPNTLDVLIAGAGQSGLAAYAQLKAAGLSVAVVDHESEPGGELRYYPEANIAPAFTAEVSTKTTVVGILPPMRETDLLEVNLSSAEGVKSVQVKALLVCAGQLDASRENNRIPGQRPAGVVTPSFVVRALKHGALPGVRPVVYVETERDVWCAAQMQRAGAEIQAVLVREGTDVPIPPSLPRATVIHSLQEIRGVARVESVVFADAEGQIRELSCDAFVFASGFYGNHFALKGSGVELDAVTGGIAVDDEYRTSIPRVYAAGTCVRPNALHTQSAADGRAAANVIAENIAQEASKEGAIHGH